MVIRESIGRVVNLLSMRAIKVTQRGMKAYVAYRKDGSIDHMNIPYLPDDATEEFISAIQGFLDHEVGHVLFSTPANEMYRGKSVMVQNMGNMVEDTFIERRMTETFPGSGSNLNSLRGFFVRKVIEPKIVAALAAGDLQTATSYLIMLQLRAWSGQTMMIDYLKDHPDFETLLTSFKEAVGDDMAEQIATVSNSEESMHLAERIVKRITDYERKKAEAARKKAEAGKKGVGTGESKAVKGDKPAKGEKAEKPKPEPTPEPDDELPPDEDDLPEPDLEGEAETETEPERAEAAEPTISRAEPEPEPEGDPDDGMSSGDIDPGGDPSDGTESAPTSLVDSLKEKRDFDKEMADAISVTAKAESADTEYRIFSTEWDDVSPGPMSKSSSSVAEIEEQTMSMVGVISKHLERAVSAQARVGWNPGMRSGRINQSSLFKASVGDDRLFRHKYERHSKRTAVSLLIDCSSSMSGGRIETAAQAAYALAMVLERLRIKYEVIGFTTHRHNAEMSAAMKKEGVECTYGSGYGRSEPLYMPVFKGFNETFNAETKSRLAHLTERPNWLNQNPDGECLQIAARRLVQVKDVERRALLVLSDGSPCAPPGHNLSEHLSKVVKDLSKDIEVVGIGIQTHSVASYYPKHVVLNNLASLPTTVVRQLANILLNP